jgi:hypothetical protein
MKTDKRPSKGIIEAVVEEITMVVEVIIGDICKMLENLIKWVIDSIFRGKDKRHKNSVNLKDLNNARSVSKSYQFGYSCNKKHAINFKDIDFSDHTFVMGGTGYGKTNLFKIMWANDLRKNKPLMVLDPKPTLDSIAYFKALNKLHNRKCYIINPSSCAIGYSYNPILNGNAEHITSRIMESFVWENSYYKNESQRVLHDTVGKLLRVGNKKPTFSKILAQLLDLDKSVQKNISGLISQVHAFGASGSEYGAICNNQAGEILTIDRIRYEGASIYFALPAMIDTEKARSFGKMITAEIRQHCGEATNIHTESYLKKDIPFSLYIDEAHDLLTMGCESLFTQGRGAGLSITVSTQTSTILNRVGDEFLNVVFQCTGNKISFRQLEEKNISYLVKSVGTLPDTKSTSQTLDGDIGDRGSVRDVQKFRIEPDLLRELPTGACVMVRSRDLLIDLVQIKNSEVTETQRLISEDIKNMALGSVDLNEIIQTDEKPTETETAF